MISDEVMDAIASIEMHRQEMAKEASVAAACNEALRKLHELLERERGGPHDPGTRHAANIDALTAEIARVKGLAGAAARPKHGRPQPGGPRRPGRPHDAPRNKPRRNTGRGR